MDGGTTGTRKVFLFFFFFSSKRGGEWKQERQFLSLYRYTFLRKGYVIGNWMQLACKMVYRIAAVCWQGGTDFINISLL